MSGRHAPRPDAELVPPPIAASICAKERSSLGRPTTSAYFGDLCGASQCLLGHRTWQPGVPAVGGGHMTPRTDGSALLLDRGELATDRQRRVDLSPCERLGAPKLLTFHRAGSCAYGRLWQNRSNRQPRQSSAPAYRPRGARPSGLASGPGDSTRADILCQARPPGISLRTNAAFQCYARLRIARPTPRSSATLAPRLSLTIISGSEKQWVADERTTVPVDTAEGGQVVRLAHLLRLNPPDGRSSHIEWQPEGHRRL
jgi:hypothetical protein